MPLDVNITFCVPTFNDAFNTDFVPSTAGFINSYAFFGAFDGNEDAI